MDPRLISGTVEMLLLEVLSKGPAYGYDITQQVLSRSGGTLELKEGSLYPALHRLERDGLLKAYWQEYDGRRRKYYRVTPAGSRALKKRKTMWRRFIGAVSGVLGESGSVQSVPTDA